MYVRGILTVLGPVLGLSWACPEPVLGLSWACPRPVLSCPGPCPGLSWAFLGSVLSCLGLCPGLYPGLCPRPVLDLSKSDMNTQEIKVSFDSH
jgi:hypothetical protein